MASCAGPLSRRVRGHDNPVTPSCLCLLEQRKSSRSHFPRTVVQRDRRVAEINGALGSILYYFGFDASGERLWLVSDVFTDADSASPITLFRAGTGTFAAPLPADTALQPWGTLTLQAGTAGDLRLELDGEDGRKSTVITRLAGLAGKR